MNSLTVKKSLSLIGGLYPYLAPGDLGEMKIIVQDNTRYKEFPRFCIKVFIYCSKKIDIDERTTEVELKEAISEIKNNLK